MDPSTDLVPTIIQGGAVGLAVMLILLVAWMLKVGIRFVETALRNNTDATNKLVGVIERLVEKIELWAPKS